MMESRLDPAAETNPLLGDILELVRKSGRGLVEVNTKLRRLLEREPADSRSSDPVPEFEFRADLVEGLDRAIAECRALRTRGAESIAIGLEVLRRKILDALAATGVYPIRADGFFRSNAHRVVSTLPGAPAGKIVSVVRRGWARRGNSGVVLLRAALIVVGAREEPAVRDA